MMMEANQNGIFKGACIGQDSTKITHFQFADDVLFFEEWSIRNAMNLLKFLKWFEAPSTLVINLNVQEQTDWRACPSIKSDLVGCHSTLQHWQNSILLLGPSGGCEYEANPKLGSYFE